MVLHRPQNVQVIHKIEWTKHSKLPDTVCFEKSKGHLFTKRKAMVFYSRPG